jgi:phage tail sheath protein FI
MATYRQRTTPGVYVTELDAFPNSVVGVQTAIPGFIGYTQKAELSGKPIYFTPTKITSLADYEQIFGTGFKPTYNIEEVPQDLARGRRTAAPAEDPNPASDNYDFSCLRQGSASPPDWTMTYYKFSRVDVAPAPSDMPFINMFDMGDISLAALSEFNLYNALRLFYANGGGTCYIASVGQYYEDDKPAKVTYEALKKGLDAMHEQSGPTMLVIPDAVLLEPTGDDPPTSTSFYQLCKDMLNQCAELQDRVAILDVYGAGTLDQQRVGWTLQMDSLIETFQKGVGDNFLNYGMSYFPFLVTSIVQPGEVDYTSVNIGDETQLGQLQGILDDQADLLYKGAKQETVKDYVAQIATVNPLDKSAVTRLNQNLVNALPLLKQMEDIMALKMSLMPPSAAMAGVYTFTDGTRGVWNAPANVTLNQVITPNVSLDNEQQGSLNVPLNGKAINVIRQFVGRGPVVWGARTLDGNSNDWRYIQVRRTLIYIEQSIEAALQPFVFAANDGKTWVAVTSMVSNFLQGLWSQGGLMGAKADEAYTVACGLGSTMTALDVLEGYMIVQVTLQMIRPAEFIELTFKQKMQGLG